MLKKFLCVAISLTMCFEYSISCIGAEEKKYIKWVDFTVTSEALADAAEADCASHGTNRELSWISILSVLGVKYGGDFSRYKKADLTSVCEKMKGGEDGASISGNEKLYSYYLSAYGATLSGLLGPYREIRTEDGSFYDEEKYGIRGFSPIGGGFYYSHYDDFGASRSYGYKRNHLGHDLMGSVGTPIIAVESGYVEACGWNQYGGWRIGIRSFDGKRYYYYAHLRKDHPYCDMYEGKTVYAGEVIGYLGMTGYSSKENTNNINVPHLHYGMQLIFDKSQKDGNNQIWIDMYELTDFLSKYRAQTVMTENERSSTAVKIPDNCPD